MSIVRQRSAIESKGLSKTTLSFTILNSCSEKTIFAAISQDVNAVRLTGYESQIKSGGGTFSGAWTLPNAAVVKKIRMDADTEKNVKLLMDKEAHVTLLVASRPGYWVIRDSLLVQKDESLVIDNTHLTAFVARIYSW